MNIKISETILIWEKITICSTGMGGPWYQVGNLPINKKKMMVNISRISGRLLDREDLYELLFPSLYFWQHVFFYFLRWIKEKNEK